MKYKLTTQHISSLKPSNKLYKVYDSSIPGFHIRVLPSGTKTFAIFYRHNGKGQDYTIGKLGRYTAKTARDEAARLMAELANGKNPQTDKKNERQQRDRERTNSLKGFIEHKYGPWCIAQHKRGNETLKLLDRNFSYLYSKNLSDITKWDIDKWRTEKLNSGLAATTVNRITSTLKGVFSRAVEWEAIPANPLAKIKPKKVDTKARIRYLSPDEESRLLTALDDRENEQITKRESGNSWRKTRNRQLKDPIKKTSFTDHLKPIVLLALHTGLRRGELFNLKWSDVMLEDSNPHFTVEGTTAKSSTTRHLPLNEIAEKTIRQWQSQSNNSGLVFPSPRTGKRMETIKSSWSSLMKRAEIKNFRLHDLRHTFASKLVMRGVSLYTVKELLGHSSIEMTQRYAHLAPENKIRAVNLLLD
jgi:integrase